MLFRSGWLGGGGIGGGGEGVGRKGGGGGGGGASPAAKKAKKAKQAKAKLSFKKRQLAKKSAAGEPTDELQAEIKELESLLSE